jgi:hypothetical protein
VICSCNVSSTPSSPSHLSAAVQRRRQPSPILCDSRHSNSSLACPKFPLGERNSYVSDRQNPRYIPCKHFYCVLGCFQGQKNGVARDLAGLRILAECGAACDKLRTLLKLIIGTLISIQKIYNLIEKINLLALSSHELFVQIPDSILIQNAFQASREILVPLVCEGRHLRGEEAHRKT